MMQDQALTWQIPEKILPDMWALGTGRDINVKAYFFFSYTKKNNNPYPGL